LLTKKANGGLIKLGKYFLNLQVGDIEVVSSKMYNGTVFEEISNFTDALWQLLPLFTYSITFFRKS
jgi:hypothetical protein